MARTNVRSKSTNVTHEGAPASHITPTQQLERSVLSCLLWEDSFYEDGVSIADRITTLASDPKVDVDKVSTLAYEARSRYNLRHAPLWLLVALARRGALKADVLADTIQRADELSEFLAMYWKDGKVPIPAQVKKGLAKAFQKFDAYQLARYNRSDAVKLRDVLFLTHAKPKDDNQAAVWKRLVDGTLEPPDTWETNLSAGKDKKETFERLLTEKRMGYMALLRNLRNMHDVGVSKGLIVGEIMRGAGRQRVLPFRFISAARAVPQWESMIEMAMLEALKNEAKIPGRTILLVDVSGSMSAPVSKKSDLSRIEAACALAILAREACEDVAVYSFSDYLNRVPDRHGFALSDAIRNSQPNSTTRLGFALSKLNEREKADRTIVFTDEQSHDVVGTPQSRGYMINVAAYANGVGYGNWTHVTGFSEAVLDFIRISEEVIS